MCVPPVFLRQPNVTFAGMMGMRRKNKNIEAYDKVAAVNTGSFATGDASTTVQDTDGDGKITKKEMKQASKGASKGSKGSEALALSGGGSSSSSSSSLDAGAAGSSGDGGGENEGDGLNDMLLDLGSHRTGRSSSLASLSSLSSLARRSTDSADWRTRRRFTSGGAHHRAPPHVLNMGRNRRPGGLLLRSGGERRRRLLATLGGFGRKRNGEGRKGEGGVFSAKLDVALLDEGAQAGVDEWTRVGGLSSGRHQAVLIGKAASTSRRAYSRAGAAAERAAETVAETAASGAKLKKSGITNTKMAKVQAQAKLVVAVTGIDPLLKQWLGGGTKNTAGTRNTALSSSSSPSNTEVANKGNESLYDTAKAPLPGTPYGRLKASHARHTASEQSSATGYTLANQGSEADKSTGYKVQQGSDVSAEDPRASSSSAAHKSGWFSKSGNVWRNSTLGKMQEARWTPSDASATRATRATRGPGSETSKRNGESLEQRLRHNVFDKASPSATSSVHGYGKGSGSRSGGAGSGARTNSEGGWQGGKKGGWVSQFATPNKARKEDKAGWNKGAREAKAGTSKQSKEANDPSLKCPEWQNPGEWKDGQCVCDPCVLNDGTDYPQLTGWGDVTVKGEIRD